MRVNVKSGIIQWGDIVGKEFIYNNARIVCSSYENDSLYINKWIGEDITGYTAMIPTVNKEECVAHLEIFGYVIEFIDVFVYSSETIQKSKGLIQAGFAKLIKQDTNYMVDNIFQQNILLEDELQYLLSNSIPEINLSEIK